MTISFVVRNKHALHIWTLSTALTTSLRLTIPSEGNEIHLTLEAYVMPPGVPLRPPAPFVTRWAELIALIELAVPKDASLRKASTRNPAPYATRQGAVTIAQ